MTLDFRNIVPNGISNGRLSRVHLEPVGCCRLVLWAGFSILSPEFEITVFMFVFYDGDVMVEFCWKCVELYLNFWRVYKISIIVFILKFKLIFIEIFCWIKRCNISLKKNIYSIVKISINVLRKRNANDTLELIAQMQLPSMHPHKHILRFHFRYN